MRRTFHSPSLTVTLVVLFLVGTLPAGQADHSEDPATVRVCMRVLNAANWGIEGIEVTPVRTAFSIGMGPGVPKLTDRDGDVAFDLPVSTFLFALRDQELPASVMRNGIAYVPQNGASETLFSDDDTHTGACPDGSDGITYNGDGVRNNGGIVRLGTTAAQGLLQLNITDKIGLPLAGKAPPLAGASVAPVPAVQVGIAGAAPPTIHQAPFARSDASGVVRMACVAGAPNNLVVQKDGWLVTPISPACSAGGGNYLDVGVWRVPVLVEARIQTSTAGSPTASPLATATFDVVDVDDHDEEIEPAIDRALATDLTLCANAGAPTVRLDSNQPPIPRRVDVDARQPVVTGSTPTPYICHANADDAGRAILRLPWTSEHHYTLKAAAPGYQPLLSELEIHAADLPPPAGSAPGVKLIDPAITLARAEVTITGTLTRVLGGAVGGASLAFAGDDTVTSDADDGEWRATLMTGNRTVSITATGFQDRSCTFELDVDEDGDPIVSKLSPGYCYTLVPAGDIAVKATLRDNEVTTANLPAGIEVCGASSRCATTTSTGGLVLLVSDSDVDQTLTFTAGQAWRDFGTPRTVLGTDAAGKIVDLGTLDALRSIAPLTVFAKTATNDKVAGASLTLTYGATRIDDPALNTTTNKGLNATTWTTGGTPIWTKYSRSGSSPYDLPDTFLLTAHQYRNASANANMYIRKASSAFDLYAEDVTRQIDLTLDVDNDVYSIAVTSKDLNGNNATASWARADIEPDPTPADLVVGPGSLVLTPGSLVLYRHAGQTVRVCADATDWYQASASSGNTTCATGIVPGTTTTVDLNVVRTTATIRLRGVDAHTTWPLAAYQLRAVSTAGAVRCMTGTAPECRVTTPNTGSFETAAGTSTNSDMVVPWTANANDLCIEGDAGNYRASWVGTNVSTQRVNDPNAPTTGEQSAYQATRFCPPGGWTPATTSVTLHLYPLRAPNVVIRGTVTDFAGALVTGAVANLSSDRPGFVCNPVLNHSAVPFPVCDAGVSVSTGSFDFLAPSALANSTWNVTVRAPGRYDETFHLWPNVANAPLTPAFKLYPRAFELTVRILDSSGFSSHACAPDQDRPVTVTLRDLAKGTPLADDYRVSATAQPDGSCLATILIPDWKRDPPPMPAVANTPWPKTTHPFLVLADQDGHAGATIAMLGPAPGDHAIEVTMLHPTIPNTNPPPGPSINGRVFDSDGLGQVTGVLGVPSVVSATGAATCPGTFTAFTDVQGSYELPLPCAGTFTVTATPMGPLASHWGSKTETIVIEDDALLPMPLARKTGSLEVRLIGFCTQVDAVPVDLALDEAPAGACTSNVFLYGPFKWGAYTISGSGGTNGVSPSLPAFIRPGTSTPAVVVSR